MDWLSLFVAIVIANVLILVTRVYISTKERRDWVPKYVAITDTESGQVIKVKIDWKNRDLNWRIGGYNLKFKIIGEHDGRNRENQEDQG